MKGPDADGYFLFALPELDYTLEVTAPGYKPWRSDDDSEQLPTQRIPVRTHDTLGLMILLDRVDEREE